MKLALAIAVGLLAAAASAQEFAPGAGDALAGFQGQIAAQKRDSADFAAAAVAAQAAPDPAPYRVRGVDVSHYQGAIDWEQVKGDGISFAYIKATEGDDVVDSTFALNWQGTARAGLRRGAYHFYNFCKPGAGQADHFIKAVPRDAGALPPTVDLELSGDCRTMPSKAAFQKQFAAFVKKVSAAYGRAPVLYVNARIYEKYLQGDAAAYKIWITDIRNAAPQLPDNRDWALWQYSFAGKVAGIPSAVDLDVFNGTPEMLAALDVRQPDMLVASAR